MSIQWLFALRAAHFSCRKEASVSFYFVCIPKKYLQNQKYKNFDIGQE